MKRRCLNCGNDFLKLHLFPTIGVGNHCNAYVCGKYGHIDFFVSVDEMKSISKSKEQVDLEIKENLELLRNLQRDFLILFKQMRKEEINIHNLELSAKNDDITVKKQKELMNQLEEFKQKIIHRLRTLSDVEINIREIKDRIETLEQSKDSLQ